VLTSHRVQLRLYTNLGNLDMATLVFRFEIKHTPVRNERATFFSNTCPSLTDSKKDIDHLSAKTNGTQNWSESKAREKYLGKAFVSNTSYALLFVSNTYVCVWRGQAASAVHYPPCVPEAPQNLLSAATNLPAFGWFFEFSRST